MEQLQNLQERLKTGNSNWEVYNVGNPKSAHDLDLVVIYNVLSPEKKFIEDEKIIKILKQIFGQNSRIFQDCQFDDYASKMSIHLLSYKKNIIKEEIPFVVKCFFEKYVHLYGKDNGQEYYELANNKIKKEPYKAKQYIAIAIRQIHHTITNPRTPLELINSLISANHYAIRTLEEISKKYKIPYKSEEMKIIKKTQSKILGKNPINKEIKKYINEQKKLSRILLDKLDSFYKKL